MRDAVSTVMVQELRYRGQDDEGPLYFTDSLTWLIHHETRREDNASPRTTVSEFADLLLDESMEEETIHEYVALKKYLPQDNTHTSTMILRGLHHPSRNRDRLDPANPVSVQRTVALLQAIVRIRKSAYEKLLSEALAYFDYGDKGHYYQSFRDEEVADLIMDHPKHCETLIELMLERGYRDGIEVFREMMSHGTQALGNGVL